MKFPPLTPQALWRAIKPTFSRNLGLKAFSLACAITLYAFVHGAQDAQRIMAVDLVVLLPPASQNRTLTTDLPTSIRVSLHGPRSIVGDLRSSDLGNMQLDLRMGRTGTIPLEPGMLRVPGGVTIDSIDPSTLDISWDDVVERPIQVQVPVTGAPAEGFVIKGRASAIPDTLLARGPSHVVGNLQVARVEPFDISGLSDGTHKRTLVVERPPPRVTYDVTHATATVEIIRKLRERVFSKVHVQIVGVARATALPSQVDVRVLGAPDFVSDLRSEQIVPRVTVREADVNKKTAALPIELELDGVQVSFVPKTVVVKW
ncbi:MAG TPA: CdaR family protein [Polyangiaceae bacterium]|jgi:YbbR domain-containing protein|nr:MAG: YbbR-like protein [Deltaproteobacteria bacterium ADurb.Bin207]HNS99198.1 CdaR family protein [Polyangiaceae bacterium]HNZ20957.1 CdaR family protein [Polyangiaceae bacterium]HOD24014.1 CdaR family protein [Polyangiaceae bacterium]HOE48881.1 CdaR family protein [Polyangiaceae bacterium]